MTTEFKSWDQLTELEKLEATYIDMYKSVYGIKARWYRAESVEQARRDLEALGQALEVELAREKAAQAEAINAFEQLAASYGGDIETAKRWQHDAYGTNGDDEFLEYHLGLPYGYFKQQQQKAA